MKYRVEVFCYDRNELTFVKTFATWEEAHALVVEKTKDMHINTSIGITDRYDEDDDTPVAPV